MFVYKPQESYKVEKKSDETLFVSIDLKEILEVNEIAISINSVTDNPKLDRVRTRKGKFLECRILPSIYDSTANFIDSKINIHIETNLGSIRSVTFTCRIFRW